MTKPTYTGNLSDAMRMAISAARGAPSGWRPFGCVIYECNPYRITRPLRERVLAVSYGTDDDGDLTRHCELLAIQEAVAKRGGELTDCTLVVTHQPCHMCAGAIKNAKLQRVVYGSSRVDLPQYFRAYNVSTEAVLADTSRPPRVWSGFMREECVALWLEWEARQRSMLMGPYDTGDAAMA